MLRILFRNLAFSLVVSEKGAGPGPTKLAKSCREIASHKNDELRSSPFTVNHQSAQFKQFQRCLRIQKRIVRTGSR
jgi:hypothetical protein